MDYRNYSRELLIEMPGGRFTADYWFIKENGIYHAFFLEKQPERMLKTEDLGIGHAISDDFLNWRYEGTVLNGFTDGWDNLHLATGSVVKCGDMYYMMYTGHSRNCPGLGMVQSSDLYHWERIGHEPVLPELCRYVADYEGTKHSCHILADPYIYPEAIDGYYYAYVNSWAADRPKNSRGCQLMFRSKNMMIWEPYKIAILTDDLDRLETAQVWQHDGRWYMYFGGRRVDPQSKNEFADVESGNYIYMSERFDGPYRKQFWSKLKYPDDVYGYIQKVITDPFGNDVALVMTPWKGVLWPYQMIYCENGEIILKPNIRETNETE